MHPSFTSSTRLSKFVSILTVALGTPFLLGQTVVPAPTTSTSESEVLVLSPFQVKTDKDKGYKATNATSGTRLDAAIKDLPLPIEVITSAFIRDTGADNLRESLRYSAGVQINSQNDYTYANAYSNPGGVNNANGQTANITDTTVVIRGFLTENSLRDGFRRLVTTDSVNLDRIEVVRGPAALLYGIGNFGGVVNYLVKRPESKAAYVVEATVGSYEFMRATFDFTGPLTNARIVAGKLAYRLTGALQDNKDRSDYYHNKKFFVAPNFLYKPWEKTEILLDMEYGETKTNGTGFQSLRGRADSGATGLATAQQRLEHAGFLTFPGRDPREFRWSGPDTHVNTKQGNVEFKLTQGLTKDLFFLAGYNYSNVEFDQRDVAANITNNIGPSSLWSTVSPVPLDPIRGDTDANWTANAVQNSIIAYGWTDSIRKTTAHQFRGELNYKLNLFEARKWLAINNSFLAGLSTEQDDITRRDSGLDTPGLVFNFKSAADPSPFRFGTQGDGTADRPMRLRSVRETTAKEVGYYAIYQGQFLNKMVTLLGGVRRDKNSVSVKQNGYLYATGGIDAGATFSTSSPSQTDDTNQIGISFAPIRQVSFYVLRSEGLSPNFDGQIDLTGRPMRAVRAKNEEIGLKFDLFDGRVSGTISKYKIVRTGQPNSQFWWGPQTAVQRFDRTKPTVYNVTDLNPDAALKYIYNNNGTPTALLQFNNNYAYYGDLNQYSTVPIAAQGATANLAGLNSYKTDGLNNLRVGVVQAWEAAKSSGAVSYWDSNGAPINEAAFASRVAASGTAAGFITINASTAQGAAYMDAVYGYTRQAGTVHVGSDNWPGWFFNSAPASTGYNSAARDTNALSGVNAAAPQTDQNDGWDGQLILTPNDQWQILLSFSINNHTIKSLGQFPNYPNTDRDRWTPWLFPNGQWGLAGYYGKNEQYANEADTSTYTFKGLIYPGAQGMDYPKKSGTIFTRYAFKKTSSLNGLTLGAGMIYSGPREYASGFTHGGDALKDNAGLPLILSTKEQYTVNVFGRYEFKIKDRASYVQLNVDNLLDDDDLYGNVYAPGRNITLGFGMKF